MQLKPDKRQHRALLINGLVFLVLAVISIMDRNYLFSGILIITAAINILAFRLWHKRKMLANTILNILNAVVSGFTSYDFFLKGSKHIWKVYIIIALAYLVLSIVFLVKHLKEEKPENE